MANGKSQVSKLGGRQLCLKLSVCVCVWGGGRACVCIPYLEILHYTHFYFQCSSVPKLARIFFQDNPADSKEVWKCCVDYQEEWLGVKSAELKQLMKAFRKQQTINMIWVSNKLEDTLPIGVSQTESLDALSKVYDGASVHSLKTAQHQLKHHLEAFLLLCQLDAFQPLSEDLIKSTHEHMMKGLLNDDDSEPITAGSYRQIPVHAGSHVYPDFSCIPKEMARIVSQYEEKFQDKRHDPFQLASWLLFEVVSLHPFEDGNGRLCRLLWCYSLMRDGLPFPLTASSGHSSSQKHFVQCIQRDRRQFQSQSALTMLTVVSVKSAWKNFYSNIQCEL